jgi:hypothetical protein
MWEAYLAAKECVSLECLDVVIQLSKSAAQESVGAGPV